MKKIIPLLACLGTALLLLSACGDDQAYDLYRAAYEELQEADSLVIEQTATLIQSQTLAGTVIEDTALFTMTWQVARDGAGAQAIVRMAVTSSDGEQNVSNSYFRDGYQYVQNESDPEQNTRQRVEADFAWKAALDMVLDLSKYVIAAQSVQNTAHGRLLTFTLDSKQYYAYFYPETMAEYGYGGYSSYREPPTYTVLLDQYGRIKEVTGHFCTVNTDSSAFTWDESYTITFRQYGGVTLDFPELDDADYLDLDNPPIEE